MARSALLLAASASVFALVDLVHKAETGAEPLHARSPRYAVVVLGLSLIWTGAILLTRSPSMALGGGVLVGGALGNLFSRAIWPGVPNPIVIETLAFNLADVFVLVGFLLVAGVALVFAARDPKRLREPVRLR